MPLSPLNPRTPTQSHWERLRELDEMLVEPQEFVAAWQVTHRSLAKICNCSVKTVDRWFSLTDHHPPTFFHKLRLAIVYRLWSKV